MSVIAADATDLVGMIRRVVMVNVFASVIFLTVAVSVLIPDMIPLIAEDAATLAGMVCRALTAIVCK